MLMSWCPGQTPPDSCDPCARIQDLGQLYIEGNTWLTFNVNAGGDGQSYLCQAVFQLIGIPADWVNKIVTGTTIITWNAYTPSDPSDPHSHGILTSGTFNLTSTGHYGGWYGEFPPLQWTLLPKTYLGVLIDLDRPFGVVNVEGTTESNGFTMEPLGTPIQAEPYTP